MNAMEEQCQAVQGQWVPGGDCDPSPCLATGACCLPDGSCQVITADACTAMQGFWVGLGSACVPDPCPQSGACCLSDGTCEVVTAEQCSAIQGTWVGPGTACVPDLCVPTPVEKTSWGRIKSSYR
jgi:hypothetical protein